MNVGNRVYFIEETGVIVFQTGEMSNASQEERPVETISYIDVPFGEVDYSKRIIIGVEGGELKFHELHHETEEQKRIRELEDALLMQADLETGGIL